MNAGETLAIDIRNLRDKQVPDQNGSKLPPDLVLGQINWRWHDGPGVVGRTNVMSESEGIASNRSCPSCACTPYSVTWAFTSSSVTLSVGSRASFSIQETDSSCDGITNQLQRSGVGTWSSSNTAVATVDGSGNVTAVGPGSATVSVSAVLGVATTPVPSKCIFDCTAPDCGFVSFSVSAQGTVTVKPRIDSVSPAQGLVGTAVGVTINGAGFVSGATVNAGSNISVSNVSVKSSSQMTATFTPANSTSAGGKQSITATAGGQTSAAGTFFAQIPTKLVRTTLPGIPNGYGPLVVLTGGANGNVANAGGQVLLTNQCGMYRNLVYSLQDQQNPAQAIDGTYTLVEMFSNYASTFGGQIPPNQNFNMTPGGLLNDIQYIGKTAPSCPGSNDHESFTQSHKVVIGSVSFPLTTVNSIQRGNYSGSAHVDVTITTP